jgi:hypothetical protein
MTRVFDKGLFFFRLEALQHHGGSNWRRLTSGETLEHVTDVSCWISVGRDSRSRHAHEMRSWEIRKSSRGTSPSHPDHPDMPQRIEMHCYHHHHMNKRHVSVSSRKSRQPCPSSHGVVWASSISLSFKNVYYSDNKSWVINGRLTERIP